MMYIRKINKPYNNALETPALLEVAFLVKNDTVNGIIGKTHGVSKAINPPRNPRKNKLMIPDDLVEFEGNNELPQFETSASTIIAGIAFLFTLTLDESSTILNCWSSIKNSSLLATS